MLLRDLWASLIDTASAVPVEHALLTAQILIGLQLISSLQNWLRRLEAAEAAAKDASQAKLKASSRPASRPNSEADLQALGIDENGGARLPPGPPHEWRTRPAMLRIAAGRRRGQQVEFNTPQSPFPVETEHFKGTMYFRLRGCAGEPRDYFFGKQRRLSAVVQGRFKTPVSMGDCFTGYEFTRPFTNVPLHWIISAGMGFIRTLAPTLVADVLGERPYFLNPLCQTIQVLHAAQPGEEPAIVERLEEHTALLGGIFAERRVDRVARKNYFARPENGGKHRFDPSLVYTMEFYEDKFDPAHFDLMIIGLRFNLHRYLDGQPLQIMGKLGSVPHAGPYLFNVELWHESLVDPQWQPSRNPSFACL